MSHRTLPKVIGLPPADAGRRLTSIVGGEIRPAAIGSEHLRDLLIVTAKLADLAVTTAKLAADAVTLAKLNDDVYGTATPTPIQDAAGAAGTLGGVVAPHDHEHGHNATIHPVAHMGWQRDNVAAGGTDVGMLVGGGNVSAIRAAYPGQIRGLSILSGGNVTQGTLTLNVTVNGTIVFTVTLDTTNPGSNHAVQAAGVDTFAAGDALRLSHTSSANLLPNGSLDIVGVLWVTYDII